MAGANVNTVDASTTALQGQPEPEQRAGAALKSAAELERFLVGGCGQNS